MEHIWQTIGSPQAMIYGKFYSEMVARFPSGSRFAEVGVFYGCSFSYLVVECINSGKKIECHAIDACPWDGQPCIGFNEHMKPLEGHFITHFERQDSFVTALKFPDQYFDFVFIDANHAYEFVSKDIAAFLPKMKKGAVISGHDWSDDGVKKAVREAFNDFTIDLDQDIWYVEL